MKAWSEHVRMAWRSLQGQKVRTLLTILIIGVGIMSLVGMLTAIDALSKAVGDNFATLGSNSFSIRSKTRWRMGGGGERKSYPAIRYEEARQFAERYTSHGMVSVSANATSTGVVRYKNKRTHPKIVIIGGDENYLEVSGFQIATGRNFQPAEASDGASVIIIGSDLVRTFFTGQSPLDEMLWIGNQRFRVIGTLESKGSGMGSGNDRMALVPLSVLRTALLTNRTTFNITVKCPTPETMHAASAEAEGLFRTIRRDLPQDESSFVIEKSDGLNSDLEGLTQMIRLGSLVIAGITLIGALVGLLNIMLVSVTERTREIGTRKALGAQRKDIVYQFLTEAMLICQLGGGLGIVLGILLGNVVSAIFSGAFILPWNWIILSVFVCFVVGVGAGLYPAIKASRLNPIDALRHE
jgi:putative ABC transport system permease protein